MRKKSTSEVKSLSAIVIQGVYRPFLGHPENLGGFPGPREFGRFLASPREFLRFLTPPREFDVFIPHTEIRARVNWPVVDWRGCIILNREHHIVFPSFRENAEIHDFPRIRGQFYGQVRGSVLPGRTHGSKKKKRKKEKMKGGRIDKYIRPEKIIVCFRFGGFEFFGSVGRSVPLLLWYVSTQRVIKFGLSKRWPTFGNILHTCQSMEF